MMSNRQRVKKIAIDFLIFIDIYVSPMSLIFVIK